MKLVKVKKTFKPEDGKIVEYEQLMLILDNGYKVAIKPAYKPKEGMPNFDRITLLAVAETYTGE